MGVRARVSGKLTMTRVDRGAKKRVDTLNRNAKRKNALDIGVFNPSIAPRAVAHEMGLGVPIRSWLRGTIDEYGKRALVQTLRGYVSADLSDKSWERFGDLLVALIQARIAGRIDPPLREQSKDGRGDGPPLVDTGSFENAITYRMIAIGKKPKASRLFKKIRRRAKKVSRFASRTLRRVRRASLSTTRSVRRYIARSSRTRRTRRST